VIRILHLSDFHFSSERAWDQDPVLNALAARIGQEVADGSSPDFVCITGDIGQRGAKADYDAAGTWIEKRLLPALPADFHLERLLFVPGNHDVDRSQVKQSQRALHKELLSAQSQDDIAGVLQDPDEREPLLRRHRAYLAFAGRFGTGTTDLPWWGRSFSLRGFDLCFAGLDSALWSSGDDDYGRLLLGRWQVNQLLATDTSAGCSSPSGLRIALLHHPWSYLAEFDQHEARDEIHRRCDLVLSGHLHQARAERRLPPDPRRGCLELAAGSAYAGSNYANAFQWIELDRTDGRLAATVGFRLWHQGEWIIDRNLPGTTEGKARWFLAEDGQSSEQHPQEDEVPRQYLAWLCAQHARVELLGMRPGKGNRITLDHVYVPALTARAQPAERTRGDRQLPLFAESESAADRHALLLDRLAAESLYVPGDPGSGKSVFCRWAVMNAACAEVFRHVVPPPEGFTEAPPLALRGRLPMLVLLREFGRWIEPRTGVRGWCRQEIEEALSAWAGRDRSHGLTGTLLRRELDRGRVFLVLDGLDEVPETSGREPEVRYPRAVLLSGLADALPAWRDRGNRLLVTSRPYGLSAAEEALLGLPRAPLAPLPDELQRLFVARWFHTLGRAEESERLWRDIGQLSSHLADLVANPMMLTALCVIYEDRKQLPQDAYELYDRIVESVLGNRYQPNERQPVRARLEAIAHGMHTGEAQDEPRQDPLAEVGVGEIDQILRRFSAANPSTEGGYLAPAQRRNELLADSGLLLPRGPDHAAFHHLSIQEFLAAEFHAHFDWDRARFEDLFRRRGQVPKWRSTLTFLLGALAVRPYRSPEWGIKLLETLIGELDRAAVKANPALAVLLAEALGIAQAKGFQIPPATRNQFQQICLAAIADEIAIDARIRLGERLGTLGDPRLDMTAPGYWIEIAGGRFAMGAQSEDSQGQNYDPDADSYSFVKESPPHRVRLGPYRIARFPVTVAQYFAFEEAGGYGQERWWAAGGFGVSSGLGRGQEQARFPNRPVVYVTWHEAMAYCAWLRARLGGPGGVVPEGWEIRLPTEAEWEYAARGPEGRRYAWGDREPSEALANFGGKVGAPTPVGLYPAGATPQGVLDLTGNVWEWCLDPYDEEYYAACARQGEVQDPTGPSAALGVSRVLRGGAWFGVSRFLRASCRFTNQPVFRHVILGLRPVLAPRRQP